jgi:conjugal transfer pilus assembly protein TraU
MKKTILLLIFIMIPGYAHAICGGKPLNPITDVAYQSIFPMKIAGVKLGMNDTGAIDLPDLADKPVCACPGEILGAPRPGITLEFWEPTIMLETVKDPFCIASLGIQIPPPPGFILPGSNQGTGSGAEFSSVQGHYYKFPVWALLELMTDFVCVEGGSFDLAWLTEVDPLWQDDSLSALFAPETLLFANPIAILSCIPDAVSSTVGLPIDALFWCMGAWGNTYPMNGHVGISDQITANAATAARLVYQEARSLQLQDGAIALCTEIPTPIWVKSHYRYQIAKPVRDIGAGVIGRSALLWEYGKNPMVGGTSAPDNFTWIVFKKRTCCAL